jgi:hypothetical protein
VLFLLKNYLRQCEMNNLAIALIIGVGSQFIAFDHVDAIELNHFYDTKGHLVYDQVVFRHWHKSTGRFHVRQWTLIDDRDPISKRPIKNEQTGVYSVEYFDTDAKTTRKVVSRVFRESWTQTDPEREDKKALPESLRYSLSKKKQPNEQPVSED